MQPRHSSSSSGADVVQAGATTADLLDHEYDGIREFDNPVPGWWHLLFWASILFSLLYYTFFTFSPIAWTVQESWESAQAAAYQQIFGELGELAPNEATIVSLMHDDRMMAVARGMFIGNCAQCHGRDGGGINGVNLTDEHYKNITSLPEMLTVINRGAGAGAMPAWENRLSQNERILLTSYAASLRGSNVAGRGPEGELIAPWPTAP